jgi:hypothetical protein
MKGLCPEVWEAFASAFTTPAHHAIDFLLYKGGGNSEGPETNYLLRYHDSFTARHPPSHPGCVVVFFCQELMLSRKAVPPSLPPSVEEAYRRKCIQLKQRMNEVEEANDASRQRIVRMERSIQKMRLERAFLLEQLSKRTSTNVEDSEGSPSPPPTVSQPHHEAPP